jgi:ATP-dependent helicase/nuclease subunit A
MSRLNPPPRVGAMKALRESQAAAADPAVNAWTSASAGTGKTQVLTARVLRLLLDGAAPERIVALTFTKAAAAEMQARIFERLADWVLADDGALDADLIAIRAAPGPEGRARARQLFARTLDARGGLRISTLHGFAQSLLASFPVEAGIAPGFTALDDRSALALRTRVLAEEIEAATATGDQQFLDDIGALSIAGGEQRLTQVAGVMIGHAEAIAALGASAGFEAKLRRWLGLPVDGSAESVLTDALAAIDLVGLRRLAMALAGDGGQKATQRADDMLCWLGFLPETRAAQLDLLIGTLFTQAGAPLAKPVPATPLKRDPSLGRLADTQIEQVAGVIDVRARLATAAHAARYLRVGQRLAAAYGAHKRRGGFIDYDDMIARAAALLATPGMGDWVRFKLDQRIDHLLVDEAQDTNEAQWDIIKALTDEFFDGLSARDIVRTLFVVGDFKQAIMSFQGSDPRVFRDRAEDFEQRIRDAGQAWRAEPLSESFRSVPTVLETVDAVLDELGHATLGMRDPVPRHGAARQGLPGSVTLWPPLGDAEVGGAEVATDAGSETEMVWIAENHVRMAQQVAAQIAVWLDPATPLYLPARGRNVRPQDILVLVRKRGEFMAPLVSALHDKGVAVAGVDRLRLTTPLAVQDLLALVRFVLQPRDDLTCASLLTSPLLGWSQDQLFALAHGRGHASLWTRLRQSAEPHAKAAHDWLGAALRLADFCAPYEFLETILSGPLGGRKRLLARLGDEARDAIGAVLAQALAFEQQNAPSLQGFLAWIERDDSDLKRDPEAALDAVRIMTVHGAKGLQAPVVILADATRDVPGDRDGFVALNPDDSTAKVPVYYGGKAGRVGAIAERADEADEAGLQEHWRLMYVAMTRAEDMLFIGGALPSARGDKPVPVPDDSWYALIDRAMDKNFPLEDVPDTVWGSRRTHQGGAGDPVPDGDGAGARAPDMALPAWATTPAPAEARPARPLSPSKLAEDDIVMPPPSPGMIAAAERGKLLHALFERLPGVAPDARRATALAWVAVNGAGLDAPAQAALVDRALAVIDAPQHAAIFGPDALAEAPIAAVVGEIVIAGKVDRLLITEDVIQIVDFKTGSRVPRDADAVERYHLRQMAAYAAALAKIFPDRRITAALLFTHDATLIELPAALLAAHAPAAVVG